MIFLVFCCSGSVNDCGEVFSKYIKNGEYFLVVNLSNQRPKGDSNNGPGGEILADAKVSKSEYDKKKVGDDFCFENWSILFDMKKLPNWFKSIFLIVAIFIGARYGYEIGYAITSWILDLLNL